MTDLKQVANYLDKKSKINIYKYCKKAYLIYLSKTNYLSRISAPIKGKLIELKSDDLKLHLGCGRVHKEKLINIDLNKSIATDLVTNVKSLPFSDNSVSRIETYHMIEHIPRYEIDEMLKEWHRVLEEDGKLIIECPDFDANIKNYLNGDNIETSLAYIFGSQRFKGDYHHWGYNFKRIKETLEDAGFTEIKEEEPLDYHKKEAPCLRVEGKK